MELYHDEIFVERRTLCIFCKRRLATVKNEMRDELVGQPQKVVTLDRANTVQNQKLYSEATTHAFLEGVSRKLLSNVGPVDDELQTAFYQGVLHALPFAVVVFDTAHRYRYCNPAAIRNPEIRQWIIGKDDFEYCAYRGFDVEMAQKRRENYLKAIDAGEALSFEEEVSTPSGEKLFYWRHFVPVFDDGKLQLVIGYSMDISPLKQAEAALHELNQKLEQRVQDRTLALERTNKQLEVIALYDPLTGLPNRTLLKERLERAYKGYQTDSRQSFALLFLDADRFKIINDTFGHDVGDEFLIAFGSRLCRCVRDSDTVARFGGDEFVILIQVGGKLARHRAIKTAERIQAAMEQPFEIAGQALSMTSSIGIVADMRRYDKPEDILRDADIAMYQAKRSGRATYRVFAQNLQEEASRLSVVESWSR